MSLFNQSGSIAEGPSGYTNYESSGGPGEGEGNNAASTAAKVTAAAMATKAAGGGGKKGGGQQAAPAIPDNGMAEMMAAYSQSMSQTMSSMMEMMATISQQQPSLPQMPALYQAPEIDWTEERGKLAKKMKADTALERARKTTRNSTVLTSPLLDDEEPSTTSTLLTRA